MEQLDDLVLKGVRYLECRPRHACPHRRVTGRYDSDLNGAPTIPRPEADIEALRTRVVVIAGGERINKDAAASRPVFLRICQLGEDISSHSPHFVCRIDRHASNLNGDRDPLWVRARQRLPVPQDPTAREISRSPKFFGMTLLTSASTFCSLHWPWNVRRFKLDQGIQKTRPLTRVMPLLEVQRQLHL